MLCVPTVLVSKAYLAGNLTQCRNGVVIDAIDFHRTALEYIDEILSHLAVLPVTKLLAEFFAKSTGIPFVFVLEIIRFRYFAHSPNRIVENAINGNVFLLVGCDDVLTANCRFNVVCHNVIVLFDYYYVTVIYSDESLLLA